jgi:hypothetical protein
MSLKKKKETWPKAYEPPRLYHINTGIQQALGVTYCSTGYDAAGGGGVCNSGYTATGDPHDPNACSIGHGAKVGPGHGNSPCGPGISACAAG